MGRAGRGRYDPPMLIPLGTERPKKRPTIVTYALIAINLAVAIASALAGAWDPESSGPGWFNSAVLARDHIGPVPLIGYMFLHGGLGHVLGNMLFLFVFGPNVEDRFGRVGFAAFYLLGGIASGLVHTASSSSGVVGASGAIAAVTGAFLVLFPLTHTRVLLFFIIIGVFSIPSWWLIAFAIAKDIFIGSLTTASPIAHEAHLGGYGFGAAVSLALLWSKALSREPYDLFSMMKHRARRRQFQELTHQGEKERERARKKIARANDPPPEVLSLRAEIGRAVGDADLPRACELYRTMLTDHGADRPLSTLTKGTQMVVANALFETGDHANAAAAYERYAEAYPGDNDTLRVKLMLAVTCARYLNDPVRAKTLLGEITDRLRTEEERDLARTLTQELG